MKLYTIGYEGITSNQLIMELTGNAVHLVIDVRELPLSRKPGFSKTPLSRLLAIAGIGYLSIPALGCPREIRHEYKRTSDWGTYKTGFQVYLAGCGEALEGISALARTRIVCLLCYEANPYRCHRSMVAQRLDSFDHERFQIVHLVPTTGSEIVGLSQHPGAEVDRLPRQ